MANLTITTASVELSDDSVPQFGVAGEPLSAGQTVRLNSADRRWYKAISSSVVGSSESTAIVILGAATGGQIGLCLGGSYVVGATLALNTLYVVSATVGLICPIVDLVTGNWVSPLFVSKSTTVGQLILKPLKFQIP